VYFLHTKTATEIVSVFQEFLSRIEAMLPDVKFSRFRCDNAKGEYDNSLMRGILRVSGISFEPSPPYSQHKNGVSERMIRTIATKARSMLLDSQLELEFWAEAVSTAAYLHTRSPSRTLDGKTPYELLWQKKPSLDHLRRFGCAAYRLIPKEQRNGKFASKSRECIMIGYVHSSTTIWKLWDKSRKSLVQASDVTFDESTVLGTLQPIEASEVNKRAEIFSSCFSDETMSDISLEDISGDISYELVPVNTGIDNTTSADSASVLPVTTGQESPTGISISTTRVPPSQIPAAEKRQNLRRSLRNRIANPILQATMAEAKQVVYEPQSYEDALAQSDGEHWRSAMKAEFISLEKNHTWDYIDRSNVPSHKSILGCRWVYKIKVNPDRSVRYKARLVIKGYQQVPGIDFDDTFAPVAKLVSFRLLIAIAAYYGWPIEQMDVVTAFLNPPVMEELYMEAPEGAEWLASSPAVLSDLSIVDKVCKLRKALYGLKQAPRLWYYDIHTFLLAENMIQSESDTNLYYSSNSKLLILLYVDDILLTGPSLPHIDYMKNKLRSHYRMSDLGPAKKYIGIEIERRHDYIIIHQQLFIQRLLVQYGMADCKGVSTPFEKNTRLCRTKDSANQMSSKMNETETQLPFSTTEYQSLVGSLQWLMIATRPDLAYPASTLGQFNSQPTLESIQAAKRVLRYLKSTYKYSLHFPTQKGAMSRQSLQRCPSSTTNEPTLERPIGYTDSDWAGDQQDRKSTYGYVFTLFATAVSWKSQKSSTVALSTTEAEYIGSCEASKEAIWITRLFHDILPNQGQPSSSEEACLIYGDNQGAIALIENPQFHQRTKHIDIRYHFIRHAYQKNLIRLQYIPTSLMTADIFTKPLPRELHYRHMLGMGLKEV